MPADAAIRGVDVIACLYGRAGLPFLEPTINDLVDAVAHLRGELIPIAIEDALAHPQRCGEVERIYVLPFDAPAGYDPAILVRELFPRALPVISFAVQDLCWNKVLTQTRLLERGIPVPESLITSNSMELRSFVKRYGFAILKERSSCGGHGDLVVWLEDGELYGDSGSHRYRLALKDQGERRVNGETLTYPAPFYVQRLVGSVRTRRFEPGQQLRAYVVDNQVRFWAERYRERYTRPSDWMVHAAREARYRFLQTVSEETQKLALRAAEVVGARIAAVDIVRTGSQGSFVLEVDTDGHHMMIDRSFKRIPEYRDFFDLDHYIARALMRSEEPVRRAGQV